MYNNQMYPNSNLMYSPQQRMEQMVNQYPQYFSPNVQQAVNTSNGWRTIQVSNIDEANATPAEWGGIPLFFYNRSANEIYMKQMDQSGAAPLITFILKSKQDEIKLSEEQTKPVTDYQNDLRKLNNKVEEIRKIVSDLKISKKD